MKARGEVLTGDQNPQLERHTLNAQPDEMMTSGDEDDDEVTFQTDVGPSRTQHSGHPRPPFETGEARRERICAAMWQQYTQHNRGQAA